MKDRLLNILLAFAVFLVVFNFFLPQPQKQGTVAGTVSVSVADKTLTVPNVPDITVTNATASGVSFDSCADLEILKDYRKIEIDGKFAPFCKKTEIAAGAKAKLDMSVIAPIFSNAGQYAFKLKAAGSESVADATVSERGFFRNVLSELFFRPVLNLFVFLIGILPGHSL